MGEPNEKQDVETSAEQEDTSKTEPETFTREQVEESARKSKSDALAEIGRYKKSADNAIKSVRAAEERIDRMLKQQEDDELEAAKEEPDRLSAIKERQTRRRVESELAKTKSELDGEKAKTTEAQEAEAKSTKERNAREIATRRVVDAKTLIKFTDGSIEAMEELARSLPKKGEATTLKPDSGRTTGGSGGIPTNMGQFRKWIADLPQGEYEKLAPEINKMMKEGRIK